MTEQDVLDGYRKDFFTKFHKILKISVGNKWETICKIDKPLQMDEIVDKVFEATGWDRNQVFDRSRVHANVYSRGLIFFILINNGFTLLSVGRKFGYHHTSVIHYRSSFENELDTDKMSVKLLCEVVDYINEFA